MKAKRRKRNNISMQQRIKAALEWNEWIKRGARPLKVKQN